MNTAHPPSLRLGSLMALMLLEAAKRNYSIQHKTNFLSLGKFFSSFLCSSTNCEDKGRKSFPLFAVIKTFNNWLFRGSIPRWLEGGEATNKRRKSWDLIGWCKKWKTFCSFSPSLRWMEIQYCWSFLAFSSPPRFVLAICVAKLQSKRIDRQLPREARVSLGSWHIPTRNRALGLDRIANWLAFDGTNHLTSYGFLIRPIERLDKMFMCAEHKKVRGNCLSSFVSCLITLFIETRLNRV